MKKFFRMFLMVIGILCLVVGAVMLLSSVIGMEPGEAIALGIVYIPLIIIGCMLVALCRRAKEKAYLYEYGIDETSLSKVKFKSEEQSILSDLAKSLSREEGTSLYTAKYLYKKFKKIFPQTNAKVNVNDSDDERYSFNICIDDIGDDALYACKKMLNDIDAKYGKTADNITAVKLQKQAELKKCVDYMNSNYFQDDPMDFELAAEILTKCVFYDQYRWEKRPYYIRMTIKVDCQKLDELINQKKVRLRQALAKLLSIVIGKEY